MKKIKFVYFDMGGVIVNHFDSLRTIAQLLGLDKEEVLAFFKGYTSKLSKGTRTWSQFEEIFYKKFGVEKKLDKKLSEVFVENLKPIKETRTLIFELSKRLDVGILSNAADEVFELIQSRGIIPQINYESIVISERLHLVKPEKEIFEYSLAQAGVRPQELLFIDDKEDNIKTARSMGWKVVLFETDNPSKSVEQIRSFV